MARPSQRAILWAGTAMAVACLALLVSSSPGKNAAKGGRAIDRTAAEPPAPAAGDPMNLEQEWHDQFLALLHDLESRGKFNFHAPQTLRPESLILPGDRDPADIVLRRSAALLADLCKTPAAGKLTQAQQDLAGLQLAGTRIDPKDAAARYDLYLRACRLRRTIALANPLLDFADILFVKHHRAIYNHMCDQYYGVAARPGGGLFVLRNAFGSNPQAQDLLANAAVENGRLKGQKISGPAVSSAKVYYNGVGGFKGDDSPVGSFLSPDLSYDGKTILFAYVECKGDGTHRHHTDPTRGHWIEGRCYHIFQVNADGTNLRQLTDGTWNDFDPVYLPNGRIAFITERRGGYLRCGRVCPNYNLFDMAADGGDINSLSVHETNEWNPSVTNDGRIIYTRWDYIDRYGCTAHQPWITTLDGRDSRAVHGNFAPRHLRPDMELDVRAIPDSTKYVATAAPHHGQAYGSLVLIDPRVKDDDAMAPVKRITPDVGFPESQGGTETYGTPWPLSEDYYLCAYDAQKEITRDHSGRGNYGLYLVDSFGNKELIYRDAQIASLSPIPLRTRPMPVSDPVPVTPVGKYNPSAAPADRQTPAEATLALVNVYDSLKPWPAGTKIKALRVLQVLPMSVPSGGPPHNTGQRIALAPDSVVVCRNVLGTVPVEEDGSAHFIVPANREMFFQALDERGLAVQSMRSATYLHAGERLTCQGCHAPKNAAPRAGTGEAMALRRAPSRLVPDVDGANPFSYPRLVQPVLERNCVPCHSKNAKAPNLNKEPITRRWYASYNNLIQKYAFTAYGDNLVTTPGRFGAQASKLYAMLAAGHHDVKPSPEDLHRITLWLDCSSMFYGVYEKDGGEVQLRGGIARPTLE